MARLSKQSSGRLVRAEFGSFLLHFVALFALAMPLVQATCSAQVATPQDNLSVLSAIEQATIQAIEKAERSVVAIARVRREQPTGDRAQLDPLRIRNPPVFQSPLENPDFVPQFFGSGVVISQDGFIVTCAHVLDDPRQHDYFVWLDKRSYQARVTGRSAQVFAADPFSDLAVIKIEDSQLVPIEFGDAENLRKGSFVIALGNPDATAIDGQASASWGIISNLKRIAPAETSQPSSPNKESIHQYGTLIQTDAKLGFGSSGGALINLRGEMIGLATSLVARTGFENSAGFAIATDGLFHRVVEALKLGQLPEYGFLGIQPEDLSPSERQHGYRGARVSVLIPGLPGDQAGLRTGDLIVEVGGRPIFNRNDLFRELSLSAAAADVEMLVHRPRPGEVQPQQVRLLARLSKKFVATSRPAFALNSLPSWRGMSVEYSTAFPPERTRGGFLGGQGSVPKLAALSVEPNTPAWRAGLRPGYGVLSSGKTTFDTPGQFHEFTRQQAGPVELTIVRSDGRLDNVVVSSEDGFE
jgi:S1-C subfamily serine protease